MDTTAAATRPKSSLPRSSSACSSSPARTARGQSATTRANSRVKTAFRIFSSSPSRAPPGPSRPPTATARRPPPHAPRRARPTFPRARIRSERLVLRLGAVAADPGEAPVGDLLLAVGHVLAPGLGAHGPLGLPHDLELTALLDLADVDGLVEVVVLAIHRD